MSGSIKLDEIEISPDIISNIFKPSGPYLGVQGEALSEKYRTLVQTTLNKLEKGKVYYVDAFTSEGDNITGTYRLDGLDSHDIPVGDRVKLVWGLDLNYI